VPSRVCRRSLAAVHLWRSAETTSPHLTSFECLVSYSLQTCHWTSTLPRSVPSASSSWDNYAASDVLRRPLHRHTGARVCLQPRRLLYRSTGWYTEKPVHTVAEKCDCRRCLAVIRDSHTFLRQCGQGLRRQETSCNASSTQLHESYRTPANATDV